MAVVSGGAIALRQTVTRPSGADRYDCPRVPSPAANFAEGQQVAYRFLLAESRRRGNTKAFNELSSLGNPPYAGPEGIAKWRRCARWLSEFGALWHGSEKFDRVGWMLASIEYSWPEKLRFSRAAERSFGLLYADLLSVNLSETVPRVEVPVFFAEGPVPRVPPENGPPATAV